MSPARWRLREEEEAVVERLRDRGPSDPWCRPEEIVAAGISPHRVRLALRRLVAAGDVIDDWEFGGRRKIYRVPVR